MARHDGHPRPASLPKDRLQILRTRWKAWKSAGLLPGGGETIFGSTNSLVKKSDSCMTAHEVKFVLQVTQVEKFPTVFCVTFFL